MNFSDTAQSLKAALQRHGNTSSDSHLNFEPTSIASILGVNLS